MYSYAAEQREYGMLLAAKSYDGEPWARAKACKKPIRATASPANLA